ncbi:hypothetical protein BV96_03766 [Sphingomonas paucimobilis]|nr:MULTISPECIES: hypothetical protein [Sphingobium]EZP69906.1 hypothetical protein BV96_03766 [Sphingomonas paucimobilis]
MPRKSSGPGNQRPPWWFMPAVMTALAAAGGLLSVAILAEG